MLAITRRLLAGPRGTLVMQSLADWLCHMHAIRHTSCILLT